MADLLEVIATARPFEPCIRIGGCLKLFGAEVGCLCDHDHRLCMCHEHVWYRRNPEDYARALNERAQ
jgi:hypothetical protein